MTKAQRLRRIAKLCLHCIRNMAYYLQRRESLLHQRENFWRTVDGNFIDMCVLEWCKLFADTRGKHYWQKVVTDENAFFQGLLSEVACTEDQFNNYIDTMKTYRDKFLAHLDDENTMNIPVLDKAKKSVFYLYKYLLDNEEENDCFNDVPAIADYFSNSSSEAETIFNNIEEMA